MNVICYRPQTGRKELRRTEFESKYTSIDSEEAQVIILIIINIKQSIITVSYEII